ncbi:MAG: hypothetical protein ABL896_15855, partial [Hylemonella sp.]
MRKLLETYNTMEQTGQGPVSRGILLRGLGTHSTESVRRVFLERLGATDLAAQIHAEPGQDSQGHGVRLWLDRPATQAWAPGHNTMQLASTLGLRTLDRETDLQREILLTLLMSPTG